MTDVGVILEFTVLCLLMDKPKSFGPNLTSQIYDASPKPIDWDEVCVRLGTKCKVCKANPVYTYYKEERIYFPWMGKMGYMLDYALDYSVCEEHKEWKKE